MPFKSEKQRRYLHAKHPEIAKRWEREAKRKGTPGDRGQKHKTTDWKKERDKLMKRG